MDALVSSMPGGDGRGAMTRTAVPASASARNFLTSSTRDGSRALRVARAIDSGVLSVNSNSSVRPSTPFGGFKQSGFGRELGMDALAGYSEVKNVFFSTE